MNDVSASPGIGHNLPPAGPADKVRQDNKDILDRLTELESKAKTVPSVIADEEQSGHVGDLLKAIRVALSQAEATKKAETEPHRKLVSEINAIFVKPSEALEKERDRIKAANEEFGLRKAAAEQRRREEEAARVREEAERRAREVQEAERKQREAEAARARAEQEAREAEERKQKELEAARAAEERNRRLREEEKRLEQERKDNAAREKAEAERRAKLRAEQEERDRQEAIKRQAEKAEADRIAAAHAGQCCRVGFQVVIDPFGLDPFLVPIDRDDAGGNAVVAPGLLNDLSKPDARPLDRLAGARHRIHAGLRGGLIERCQRLDGFDGAADRTRIHPGGGDLLVDFGFRQPHGEVDVGAELDLHDVAVERRLRGDLLVHDVVPSFD